MNLIDYDLIVSDVFYKSYHILDYIEKNPKMSDLDREAISATIMDALVYKKLIDPEKQSLDFDNLCICDDTDHYCYEKQPFVTSIPLDIKEKMRGKCFCISGGMPASVFYSKAAGPVSFCIYDMNTVFSAFFDEFTFITCNYNSPTREGVVAKDRPFIEVVINDTLYLVDALTKRMFRSDLFRERYNLEEVNSIKKSEFDNEQQKYYESMVVEHINYATIIPFITSPEFSKVNKMAEMMYEVEKSRDYFPEQFEEAEIMMNDIKSLDDSMFLRKYSKKNKK